MNQPYDYFPENLILLQAHHSKVWQAVHEYTGKPLGELQPAEDGKPNLLVRKEDGEEVLLHDPEAPLSELAGYYNLVPENATGVAVFIGMGLGYTPPAMLASRPHLRHVLILEPEIGLFLQALHALDLTELFLDRRVTIAVGHNINVPASFAPMSRALQLESLYILKHTPCFRISPEIYTNLHDEIYKHGNAYNVGGNTTTAYGGKFIENRLKNLSVIHHQQLLEHLKDAFVGVPAIIVAGGPSLNKNIHLLSQAKGRSVIIAADTVLPALLAHGVTPDFTSCIDMQDITLEKIVEVAEEAKGTSLICSSWLTPAVTKNFPARQVYWSFTAKNMEKWLNNLLGGKILTTGAGTVAQLNFTAAYLLGCSPIVFVGQDLAFSAEESHALHTALTGRDELKSLQDRGEIMWVDGYGGGKVPTYRAYLGFKHHFEQSMAVIKDRHFINATEGGARLEGAEELPLQAVLARYCGEKVDVAATVRQAEQKNPLPDSRRLIAEFARQLKDIAVVEKDLASLDELALKLSREIGQLKKQQVGCRKFETLPVSLQRQFMALDALNAKLDKAKIWSLLDEATMSGLCLSERLKHEITQLADDPDRYLDWLDKAIDRFVQISRFRRQVMAPFAKQLKELHNHLQRDLFLFKKIFKQKDGDQETIMELLELYSASGDHILLENAIAAHCPGRGDSAGFCFYRGVIAAHRANFVGMEKHFAQAVSLDPSWTGRIKTCRMELADRYFGFYREWQRNDRLVSLRMLLKALRYAKDHPQLCQAVNAEVDRLLSLPEAEPGQDGLHDAQPALELMGSELLCNPNLDGLMAPVAKASLFFFLGQAFFKREEYAEALANYEKAAALAPNDAKIQVAIFEASFNSGLFDVGVAALNRAVELDQSLAGCWEELGDLLAAGGQTSDALVAYEKCYTAMPERDYLVKKMGDCYLALDQHEAAHEAYRQFKALLD